MQIAERDWVDVYVGKKSECQVYLLRLKQNHPRLFEGKKFRYQNRSTILDDLNYWALQIY